MKGKTLSMLPLLHTTWTNWLQSHPDSLVLSGDTGHTRNYQIDPYAGYRNRAGTYFPVQRLDPRYHPKQQTLGLEVEGHFKAYPFVELDRAGGEVHDSLAGQRVRVFYNRASHSTWAEDASGKNIPTVTLFWFAWMAFHPGSAVFESLENIAELMADD